MIYHKYNFVDTYSNADGSSKNAMVLGELGKVLRTEPQAVASALKDAGVRVPRKPSRKDLARLIVRNKRNRKLSENLGVLITLNATSMNFSNAGGSEGGETQDDGLGVKIPTLSGSAGLQGLSKGTQSLQGTEKGGWLKGIGDFFKKRSEDKANAGQTKSTTEPSGWKKFTSWFSNNRETIGQVGTSVYNSLQAGGQIPTGAGNDTGANPIYEPSWFERNKGFVVVGAIVAVGAIAYFATKKK
jgi:hypothetical protein